MTLLAVANPGTLSSYTEDNLSLLSAYWPALAAAALTVVVVAVFLIAEHRSSSTDFLIVVPTVVILGLVASLATFVVCTFSAYGQSNREYAGSLRPWISETYGADIDQETAMRLIDGGPVAVNVSGEGVLVTLERVEKGDVALFVGGKALLAVDGR
ncbi:hypothetical protein [Frigoribacterium sp. SL97]|uniref:hypothetical protein n=1 Tax=Frigoribacterium sp. SL97 TaxID=2994664 RepID=UPI0022721B2D|nr:hypothetical protein [Frigoribacterium sp. SL97]WAC50545.1 hypothetical protein OVA02_11745 [Frigoribacterium sp. SL97]